MEVEIWSHIYKTLVFYFVALFLVRMMGKRALGEMSLFDFVIMAGVGDIIVTMGLNVKTPLWSGITVLLVLAFLERFFSWLTSRYRKLSKLIEGSPTIVVYKGKVIRENLRKENLSEADLSQGMRQQGISDIRQVELAVFEASGKFSIISRQQPDMPDSGQIKQIETLLKKVAEIHEAIHQLQHIQNFGKEKEEN